MNFCAIIKITVKYHHLIPHQNDVLDKFHVSKMFSKIDLKSGFHKILMNSGNE